MLKQFIHKQRSQKRFFHALALECTKDNLPNSSNTCCMLTEIVPVLSPKNKSPQHHLSWPEPQQPTKTFKKTKTAVKI